MGSGVSRMKDANRRDAIKTMAVVVGGVATILMLPDRWVKPVVDAVVTPANAAGLSFWQATTTTTTTTYSPPI